MLPKSKKWLELQATLNYYGYSIEKLNNKSGYQDRKRPVYGVYDRRSGGLMCAYTGTDQISKWLSRQLTKT
jgi:hypothetical protein